ncbi:MAG: hypothetical protein ACLUDU_08015 [Butyricimonas faecihominis]
MANDTLLDITEGYAYPQKYRLTDSLLPAGKLAGLLISTKTESCSGWRILSC